MLFIILSPDLISAYAEFTFIGRFGIIWSDSVCKENLVNAT